MLDNNAAYQRAEQAAATRLLNCYLREVVKANQPLPSPYMLLLPQTGRVLQLSFRYQSLTGHHRYHFPVQGQETEQSHVSELDFTGLVDWLLTELAAAQSGSQESNEASRSSLESKITNSVQKTALYLLKKDIGAAAESYEYVRSEQSLLFGHPFHPTPKSSEGFTEDDVERFAPERGSSFQLDYWLVHPELFREEWVTASPLQEEWLLREKKLVSKKAGNDEQAYRLLPCHPWQSDYLKTLPAVQGWIGTGKLRQLGALEEDAVYPTASVRTVWSPAQELFLKLPLHVRITNFVRTNSPEQCLRSLDAARVWTGIGTSFAWEGFGLLQEHSCLSLEDEELAVETAVLLRESHVGLASSEEDWHVAASMLEDELQTPAWLPATTAMAEAWVERYTAIYLLPVMKLYAEYGFGLEAHVQNTLIRLQEGLPVQCFVRDLEGVSVVRTTAEEKGWVHTILSSDSPVLYSDEEGWMRLLYYNLTNHMSHMVAAVSRSSGTDEERLWHHAGRCLLNRAEQESVSLRQCVGRLFAARTLPAKANLVSWFARKGETPDYVHIPNPLYQAAAAEGKQPVAAAGR